MTNISHGNELLPQVYKLCESLKANEINYCHWKSNAMLYRSASGDNDLDLLISRRNIQQFNVILYKLGFKLAITTTNSQIPGILNYYCYDKYAHKLVHVHAHYRLIVGHDATKNYHLPIEEPYLKSAIQGDLFAVPSPEFEIVVFIIRMVLKHSTLYAIINKQGALTYNEFQELKYLESLASKEKTNEIIKKHLPYINVKLFKACIRSLKPDCSFFYRVKVGHQLQKCLSSNARRGMVSDVCIKGWRRVVRGINWRIFGHKYKKIMSSGGLIVALVGGDGAGKTTAVKNLHTWLSKDFEVINLHMGKPRWSQTTIIIRGILKVGRSLCYPFFRESINISIEKNNYEFPGYPWIICKICVARDRYLTYLRARRLASNGFVVICDRFPLTNVKLMDGPQIERMTRGYKRNFLIDFFIKLEKLYYMSFNQPDLLFILKVAPEIAVSRKTDENSNSVKARSTEIWNYDFQENHAHIIDASRSIIEVLEEIKNIVWSEL